MKYVCKNISPFLEFFIQKHIILLIWFNNTIRNTSSGVYLQKLKKYVRLKYLNKLINCQISYSGLIILHKI